MLLSSIPRRPALIRPLFPPAPSNSLVIVDIMKEVRKVALKPQTGISLRNLIEFGTNNTKSTIIQSAVFLHRELPIRLAHRVRDLDRLPYGLCLMPSIRQVKNWYLSSFEELISMKQPRTVADAEFLTERIKDIYIRHRPTLVMVARGVYELKRELSKAWSADHQGEAADFDLSDFTELHQALDNFYMSRVGIRMLIGQHLEMFSNPSAPISTSAAVSGFAPAAPPPPPPRKDYIGLINLRTSAAAVAQDAINDARYVCERQNFIAPEVKIMGRTDLYFPYVPSHLYYMLFELLKNSMRAVSEYHMKRDVLPPVRLIIADGEDNEDVAIKISDEGGGIPRSQLPKIWSYMFTTAPNAFTALSSEVFPDFGRDAPLAGLGYGLPISRLYSRYFGGDLQLLSMEGYGTDAYLYLNRLGDSEEPLP